MFQGRSFLKEIDFSKDELLYLIDFAIHLKKLKKEHIQHKYLLDKNIALIFEKTSTRTRAAFTTAAIDLGAHPEFLGPNDIQLGKKESISDTAKVLGTMFDGIEFRGFKQSDVEILAKDSQVPVWNGLTDDWHPTQMLADFMTIKEHFGYLKGLTLAYVGDGRNNVAHSLLVTGAIFGVNVTIISPESLQPAHEIQKLARNYALRTHSEISIRSDLNGLENADIVYTDVLGQHGRRKPNSRANQVTKILPNQSKSGG
ncbi:Ornithine carbamoyltransferase [Lactococcus cremoris subsp. cremoris A76]|nr:Ornithine carbamoyltransferase [Lactococcus cremoris subsp. cremoris A76]